MLKIIRLTLIIFIIYTFNIYAKSVLTIYYFERPPYYYTDSNGNPNGILNKLIKKILDDANIKYKFESVPSKRIFYFLEKNDYACSSGWYKTKERLKKFKYTLPIYQSEKIFGVCNPKVNLKKDNVSLNDFLVQKLKIGLKSGFKYGPIIENFIKTKHPNIEYVTTSTNNIFKMVAFHRFDCTFFSKENINNFLKKNPQFKDKIKIVNIKEIKKGNKRYIICSKRVNDDIIKKINRSIIKLKILKQ